MLQIVTENDMPCASPEAVAYAYNNALTDARLKDILKSHHINAKSDVSANAMNPYPHAFLSELVTSLILGTAPKRWPSSAKYHRNCRNECCRGTNRAPEESINN